MYIYFNMCNNNYQWEVSVSIIELLIVILSDHPPTGWNFAHNSQIETHSISIACCHLPYLNRSTFTEAWPGRSRFYIDPSNQGVTLCWTHWIPIAVNAPFSTMELVRWSGLAYTADLQRWERNPLWLSGISLTALDLAIRSPAIETNQPFASLNESFCAYSRIIWGDLE